MYIQVGDMTCWYAAYRIFEFARDNPSSTNAGALPAGWQAAADPATGAIFFVFFPPQNK
jgi:hypothetical protein